MATNQTDAIHTSQTDSMTIPRGILGTYPGTGPLPGTDVKIPLSEQNWVLSQTTVVQPITQMFKIHAGVSAAEAEARMAHDDLERAQNEVSLNVKKLYYGLLSTQERKHAAELRLQAGEERLKESKDATQSGVALQVKVLEGEAEIAEARHTLGSLEDQIADMTNSFNDLVGLPLPTDTELIEPVEQPDEEQTIASAAVAPEAAAAALGAVAAVPEHEAINHNPELRSAQQALAKAHAGLNAARAEYIPDVSLVFEHVYQNGVAASAGQFRGGRSAHELDDLGVRPARRQGSGAQGSCMRRQKKIFSLRREGFGWMCSPRLARFIVPRPASKPRGKALPHEPNLFASPMTRLWRRQPTSLHSRMRRPNWPMRRRNSSTREMQRVVARAELVRTEGRQ